MSNIIIMSNIRVDNASSAVYSGALTAVLAAPASYQPIDTMQDLVRAAHTRKITLLQTNTNAIGMQLLVHRWQLVYL